MANETYEGWGLQARIGDLLESYGLGVLFAANVFGAGSVYILADTGANFAFALLWVLPLAFLIDIALHDMSARLAVAREPLTDYIIDIIPGGSALIIGMGFMSALWAISNYAIAGAALAWLVPGLDNVALGILISGGLGIALVELRVYERIEGAIAAMVITVFGSYGLLLIGLDIPISDVAAGLVPMIRSEIGYLTAVIALLGTTVYWPNFFIQSSIGPTKEWTDVNKYRRDNAVGIMTTLTIGAFVMIVSAITLTQGEMTLTSPGEPLAAVLGDFALYIFLLAALLASFSSATGTLFGAGFMVPQSLGHHTVFGDRGFRMTVVGLIVFSTISAFWLLANTGLTPVRMAIIMPAIALQADEERNELQTVLRTGEEAEEIVAYTEEQGVDHVVIGSHGRDGISRILLGSIAEAVVRQSPVPVTVVR